VTREELGLPASGFVFCCFNNNFKITPAVFDIWMRILKRVDGGVLWLLEDNASASANLRSEAERRGVAPERLVFAARASQSEHLARHRAADLFLDTLPYNAHTTASDALWAGLPLLTCQGQSFAGRVAGSILKALDLPELVTASSEEYEARAVALAAEPGLLADIKRRLEENRLTAPLFNAAMYARQIESAYAQMVERYHSGQPPDHIHVAQ
jgi:predicted O-linked N-acetylglucosamine transferase (SPINDLY family)